MDHREFIGTLALALLAAPLAAEAQPAGKMYRIAFLSNDGLPSTMCVPDSSDAGFRALRDGLRELGYVEGVNITIDCRSAEGDYSRLPRLARELVQANPHVIVARSAPASLAAKATTATLPIVSVYMADPAGLGLVASLARPGGNVTGLSALAADHVAKSLQLLKEAVQTSNTDRGSWACPIRPSLSTDGRWSLRGGTLGLRLEFHEMVSGGDIDAPWRHWAKASVLSS